MTTHIQIIGPKKKERNFYLRIWRAPKRVRHRRRNDSNRL